jgi:hypothetical protein
VKQFDLVRFNHEKNGGPVHRVVSVMPDGMIEIHDIGGYFAPHLFTPADDVADIPSPPTTAHPLKRILIDGKPSRVVPVEPSQAQAFAGLPTSNYRASYRAMLAASDPALTEAVVEMREACAAAAKTFRWYEELHAAKGPEHADKAARNRIEAVKLEAALARITVETTDD